MQNLSTKVCVYSNENKLPNVKVSGKFFYGTSETFLKILVCLKIQMDLYRNFLNVLKDLQDLCTYKK